jgi:hypothetical protein
MKYLIDYYIIDRKTGISYNPYVCMGKYLIAYPNIATGKQTIINAAKLKKGLAERRYRLIPKAN